MTNGQTAEERTDTHGASNDSTAGVGNPAPLHWPRTAQHTRDAGHRTRERRVQTAMGQTSITTALNIGTVNTDDERKKTGNREQGTVTDTKNTRARTTTTDERADR